MPNKVRSKWQRPFNWPPSTWEFTPGMQAAADIFLAFVFLLLVITVIAAMLIWPMLIARTFQNIAVGSADDVRNTLLAVAALIGVPFLIWRTLIAAKQTDISREGHYTGLFTKAVEQLGTEKTVKRRDFKPEYQKDAANNRILDNEKKPIPLTDADGEPVGDYVAYEVSVKNYEVRLGAIYALERIAQDSKRDAWPIYQTLCAYIQNNAPQKEKLEKREARTNSSDIDEIFSVLSRYRGPRDVQTPVIFESIHLETLGLREGDFTNFVIRGCSIYVMYAELEVSELIFRDCEIGRLVFKEAKVTESGIYDGKIRELRFSQAEVDGFETGSVSIEELHVSVSKVVDVIFNLSSTKISAFASEFRNTVFNGIEQGFFYTARPHSVTDCDFHDCEFQNCDFSLVNLSSNRFSRCKFVNCNLVEAGEIRGESNVFDHCMTSDDVSLTSEEDALLQMRQQWSRWKFNFRSAS
jgi:hypothetical protein